MGTARAESPRDQRLQPRAPAAPQKSHALLRGLLTVLSAQCSLGVTAHWLTGAQGLLQQQLGRALWLRLESNSKEVSGADSAEQATGALPLMHSAGSGNNKLQY